MELPSFFGGRSKQLIAIEARIYIDSSFFYAFLSNPLIQRKIFGTTIPSKKSCRFYGKIWLIK